MLCFFVWFFFLLAQYSKMVLLFVMFDLLVWFALFCFVKMFRLFVCLLLLYVAFESHNEEKLKNYYFTDISD